MFNFSSESQKALIGQPWTVPWALITQAAKTGLGRRLGRRGAGFVRDTSMVTQHPHTKMKEWKLINLMQCVNG